MIDPHITHYASGFVKGMLATQPATKSCNVRFVESESNKPVWDHSEQIIIAPSHPSNELNDYLSVRAIFEAMLTNRVEPHVIFEPTHDPFVNLGYVIACILNLAFISPTGEIVAPHIVKNHLSVKAVFPPTERGVQLVLNIADFLKNATIAEFTRISTECPADHDSEENTRDNDMFEVAYKSIILKTLSADHNMLRDDQALAELILDDLLINDEDVIKAEPTWSAVTVESVTKTHTSTH